MDQTTTTTTTAEKLGPDQTTKKMDTAKKMDAGPASGDNLQPVKVKFGDVTLQRGDEQAAKKIVADARTSGQIQDSTGQKHDVNSPKGKGIIAQIQALGQGDSPRGAEAQGKMVADRAASIAKTNNVLKAQGKPLIGASKSPASGSSASKPLQMAGAAN